MEVGSKGPNLNEISKREKTTNGSQATYIYERISDHYNQSTKRLVDWSL